MIEGPEQDIEQVVQLLPGIDAPTQRITTIKVKEV